jgi:hypothetical protein
LFDWRKRRSESIPARFLPVVDRCHLKDTRFSRSVIAYSAKLWPSAQSARKVRIVYPTGPSVTRGAAQNLLELVRFH